VTGDLLATLEMLRPHLGPGGDIAELVRGWRLAMLAWCRAVEAAEQRRQRFEERVAARIAEFQTMLEDKNGRNLRVRFMRLQIEEMQAKHDELRARLAVPKVVWQHEIELERRNAQRLAEWKERREQFFAERKARRERRG